MNTLLVLFSIGEENYLSLYLFKFLTETPVTKHKGTWKKHTNSLNISFMCHKRLSKEMNTSRKLSPTCFYAKLLMVVKDIIEQRVWGKRRNLEKLSKANIRRPLMSLLSSDRDVPFLWHREGINLSQDFFMTCFIFLWPASEVQNILPAHAISQVPSALNVQYVKVPYFGVPCPELHCYHYYFFS